MKGRWNDDVAGYPDYLLVALTPGIKHVAAAYIEENCPLAWFKPMFDGTAQGL